MGGTPKAEVTQWALAARSGDQMARERFVRATRQDVWRFLAHVAGVQAADDLTQETYVRALRSLPRFSGRSSAHTWLLSIARRVAVDHYRVSMVRPRRANVEDWESAADRAQLRGAPRFEDDVALASLLAELSPERRTAFVLTQFYGLSYQEAAEVCECAVGTIRSRVARARDDLITLLRDAERIV